jgi:hypothetical protein
MWARTRQSCTTRSFAPSLHLGGVSNLAVVPDGSSRFRSVSSRLLPRTGHRDRPERGIPRGERTSEPLGEPKVLVIATRRLTASGSGSPLPGRGRGADDPVGLRRQRYCAQGRDAHRLPPRAAVRHHPLRGHAMVDGANQGIARRRILASAIREFWHASRSGAAERATVLAG